MGTKSKIETMSDTDFIALYETVLRGRTVSYGNIKGNVDVIRERVTNEMLRRTEKPETYITVKLGDK